MTARKKGSSARFDRARAVRILLDAAATSDRKAAKAHGVTEKTIGNYRRRLAEDPELSDSFHKATSAIERGWHVARARALRIAADRAAVLLEKETDLDKISKFIERTGGVDIASEALGVGDSSGPPGERPEAPPRDPGEAEAHPLQH